MLTMHYWPSITSLASQHPKNHTCSVQSCSSPHSFALPRQALGSPSEIDPCAAPFPHQLYTHFVRPTQLQPSLSAGFRDIIYAHADEDVYMLWGTPFYRGVAVRVLWEYGGKGDRLGFVGSSRGRQ